MPEDLWELKEQVANDLELAIFTFKRDVKETDWKRFDFYAPFVRDLGVIEKRPSPVNLIVIDDRVYRELVRRDTVLLPNLRTLITPSNDLPFASLLLTPHIHQLTINVDHSQSTSFSCLARAILLRAPSLKSLHL
ncbi:hypothetical protein BDZ97DRAFT_1921311 [Flammula alnicola]|nr:hypothetical protein BDZ97DRAFT_1921311 [Flammula alnicola]